MIDWWKFDWPSFATLMGAVATLIVGIVAVRYAYLVGIKQARIAQRQADILDRQADILDRQTALADISVKADLFERRLATYEIAADFTLNLQDLGDTDEGAARIALFATKMRESQFLFSLPVYEALIEIWEAGNRLRTARAISISNYHAKQRNDAAISTTIDQLTIWKTRRIETLHEVFRADLEVGARGLVSDKIRGT